MSVAATVLFGRPQQEIRSLIALRLSKSIATSIVTGFATPGGLDAIAEPIKTRPGSISAIILGASTYPGFETLDELHGAGVPLDRLHVHLGHTRSSGSRKHATVRFHPMLHSKIYYMELPSGQACAFVGSHNMTSFALKGLNGEAGILLEGPISSPEFQKVRGHIEEARQQSLAYSPDMKESLAWWTREFIDGMRSEVKLPIEWITIRTILVFARAEKADRLKVGDELYFEIPAGIERIDSLSTETHLFLFSSPPSSPWEALHRALSADASYTCKTLGAENKQGNREVGANWRIEGSSPPAIKAVPSKVFRPTTPSGMQQVRAEVTAQGVSPYEYLFDRQKKEWDPVYSQREGASVALDLEGPGPIEGKADVDDPHPKTGWRLVAALRPRERVPQERDAAALERAKPDSGTFILVSLRRRYRADDSKDGSLWTS